MPYPSPPSWTPTGLFAVLALYFADKAIRPGARKNWAWGWKLDAAPISKTGYALIALTFLDIAAIMVWLPKPPMVFVLILFVCFLALGVIGFRDFNAHRRQVKRSGHL